jgi:hypothetical protein
LPRTAGGISATVLLVHGLLAHAQRLRDLLPGPALVAGVLDLELLKRRKQRPKRGNRTQPDLRVSARGGLTGQLGRRVVTHRRQDSLTQRV